MGVKTATAAALLLAVPAHADTLYVPDPPPQAGHLQCWQHGSKIIDEEGLTAATPLASGGTGRILGFHADAKVYEVVIEGDTTCLLKPPSPPR
jgi:hypothetical protein